MHLMASNAFCLAKMHFESFLNAFWLCKNAFDAKMHFCTASHFPKENVQLCKNAFDAKMFDAKMHFGQNAFWLCKNAFDAKMHFGNASHFPKENVQQRCAKMHFCINFTK